MGEDAGSYDLVVVGTSFASSFFLHGYLARARAGARVLVLERGALETHARQLAERTRSAAGTARADWARSYENRTPAKPWTTTLRFGGNSNCWAALTPRFLPEDFRLRSAHGVGADWPVGYDDLEPFYLEAETLMSVSGPEGRAPAPRSGPYPQPPHRFSEPDRLLARAFPDAYFHAPCARPTVATPRRPPCCGNLVCALCPIDAKFAVLNELRHLYEDGRVTLALGAHARAVEITARRATGIRYLQRGRELVARGDLVALGCNAIFNPHLLRRSGLDHPELGAGLVDHVGVDVRVGLRGLRGLQGSTTVTGHGYMLYGGPRRRDRAGALLEARSTVLELRNERGKHTHALGLRAVFEDLRDPGSRVSPSADPDVPAVTYAGPSAYTRRAMAALASDLGPVLAALPVESVEIAARPVPSMFHALGTTPMGADPARSIVDRHLVHHEVRNLVVLGAGAFVTSSPANPTLTLSALSLWSASHLLGGARP